MKGRYSVRKADTKDSRELARLRWEYRVEDQPRQAYEDFLETCASWLAAAMKSERWVVSVASGADRSLCGCMYLECVEKIPVPGETDRAWGYVTNAYVADEQRGDGLGGAMLDLLIEAAGKRDLEFLIVWPSVGAVTLYERAGFRRASEVHDRPDDYPPLELRL